MTPRRLLIIAPILLALADRPLLAGPPEQFDEPTLVGAAMSRLGDFVERLIPWPLLPTPHPADVPDAPQDRWFLGQDVAGEVPFWGEAVTGTDLGITVEAFGDSWFYLGDTLGRGHGLPCGCRQGGCNDAIFRLARDETRPEDGIEIVPVGRERVATGFSPQVVPGIHRAPIAASLSCNAVFTVPTGATGYVFDRPARAGVLAGQPVTLETIILFSALAARPDRLVAGDVNRTPRSFGSWSVDGLHFRALWPRGVAFSADSPEAPARFVQIAPVALGADPLARTCAARPDSVLCRPESFDTARPRGGLLLYGTGRWYRASGLYLAFVRDDELGRVDPASRRPLAWYLGRDPRGALTWSRDERAATPLVMPGQDATFHETLAACDRAPTMRDCQAAVVAAAQTDRDLGAQLFGEIAVSLVTTGLPADQPPALVLLSQHAGRPRVQARTASLAEPWRLSAPTAGRTGGYGPYVIERFTRFDAARRVLTLWHLVSHWRGASRAGRPFPAYGVYSNRLELPWPPR